MKTAEKYLKEVCAPFEKTFEPNGDNLYLEVNVIKVMNWYAQQAVERYRKLLDNKTTTYNALNTINKMAEKVKSELK